MLNYSTPELTIANYQAPDLGYVENMAFRRVL